MAAERESILAFRASGHNLHRRTDALTAIAACGIQEVFPGGAALALHARSLDPAPADEVVLVQAMRGAPWLVPRRDVAVFTRAIVPDDDGLKSLVLARAAKEIPAQGITIREALDRVADAARDALADGPLGRDDFHQALRERLPDALLPYCRGCDSHHVSPMVWRALGPLGVTEMPARATFALARPSAMPLEAARAELARRFLRCYGPATHTHLAAWAQTAPAHAKALLGAIKSELEPVGRAFVLAADAERLAAPPRIEGIRLLGGHDPYVAQPDRVALVPDRALARRMFPAIGRPGVVLVDGEIRGLWRARRKKDALDVEVQWVGEAVDIRAEADAVARLRGCSRARVAA